MTSWPAAPAACATVTTHCDYFALGIDWEEWSEILGTIAGDDTILVVPRDGVSRSELFASLAERIPGLEEAGA